MNRKELNNLVALYQTGDELAINELFKAVNPMIEKVSSEIEFAVENSAKFDCRMVYKIKKLLEKFDPDKHDYISSVKTLLTQEKSNFLRRHRRKLDSVQMSAFDGSEETDSPGFQFEDTSAKFEDEVIDSVTVKEKIALLAQNDLRKKMIIQEWLKGADDKSISKLLAQRLGGNWDSHRRFITRYKAECRSLLAETV